MHPARSGDRNVVGGDRGLPDRGYGFKRRGDRWLPDRWLGPGAPGVITPPPTGIQDGDIVTAWPDSSGNGHDGAKTGSPIIKLNILNGKPVVRLRSASLDGFNLASPVSGAGDWTAFIVCKPLTPTSILVGLGSDNASSVYSHINGTDGNSTFAFNRNGYIAAGPANDAFHVITADFQTGISTSIFKDGTNVTFNFTALPNSGDFKAIGYILDGSYRSDGDIAEIILYQGALALRVKLTLLFGLLLTTGEFPSPAEFDHLVGHRHRIRRYLHLHGANPTQAQLDAVVTPMAAGDRANIEKTLSVKYSTPAPPSGTVIDPYSIPGMMAWYKADSLALPPPIMGNPPLNDGDTIVTWPDVSGHANDAHKVGTPIFKKNVFSGQPSVHLSGSSGFNLTVPVNGAGPWEMFAVMKPSTGKTVYSLCASTGNGPLGVCELDIDYLFAQSKAFAAYLTPNPYDGVFHILNGTFDGLGGAAFGVDGPGVAPTIFASASTGDFDQVAYRGFDSTFSDGDLCEICFFNRQLLTTGPFERSGVWNFFLGRYGLPPVDGTTPMDPTTLSGAPCMLWLSAPALLSPPFTMKDTVVSGDNVRIMTPLNRVSGTALIWCHGMGGSEKDINLTPNTVYSYAALGAGHLVAAANAFGYNWSNPTAQAAVEALVAYLVTNYGVNKVVMFGGSAGGPVGLLKTTQGFPGAPVKGWHGIFPVCDLALAETHPSLKASIDTAFPGYPAGTAGRDPMLFSASAFNGLRLRCMGSLADTVVPVNLHGQKLMAQAAGHALENTCIVTTGDHGDMSNFTPALADDFTAFIGRCFT